MNKTELSPFPPSGGISVKDCNLWYGDFQALKEDRHGDSGKTDHRPDRPLGLRKIHLPQNPQPDERSGSRVPDRGKVFYSTGRISSTEDTDVTQLRKKVGMVFQKPNPFPMSVYDNIAFGPRHARHSPQRPSSMQHCENEPAAGEPSGMRSRTG